MYNQRDVVIIPFPYTDLTGNKQRPALIISNKNINNTEDRVCCLITSKPSTGIVIDAFENGNLPYKSWIKPHRLFTISEKIVKKKLCTISSSIHTKVIKEINGFLK